MPVLSKMAGNRGAAACTASLFCGAFWILSKQDAIRTIRAGGGQHPGAH
ncbi:hypothetical protein DESPIG_01739 [Desulfovibrio piger ATCC 29098]|uniref:Uncharacterized protein n=1 Tax=Desulfovibrio piger ATCC 29098 TaxID=411464 RepID=B6WUJ6_9BACT|nr:hypothetical protein DESPIG_01739 [Desulfovibrio piger ATCC 29098]